MRIINYIINFGVLVSMVSFPSATLAQKDTIFRSFSIAAVNDGVLLNFTIFKGITCTGVQIERSTDNVNFTEIFEFAGVCGAINTEESYTYLDETPINNQLSYYRLDLGSIGLNSETLSIKFINYSNDGVTVFSNPSSSNSTIYFSNPNNNELQLLFLDRMEKLVMNETTTSNRWESDSKQFSVGLYFFQILYDGKEKYSGKIVVF